MQFKIDPFFAELGMPLHLGMLDYEISVAPASSELNQTISEAAELRQQELLGEAAATDPVIADVRAAFKAIGKDPSRYRPSSEALTRRIVAGKGLYSVNNIVDCGNLVSLMTGLPIGCYDAAWIKGDMMLRPGTPGETYNGVGRKSINLEGLAVLADNDGPFGSAFSDSERTAITENTQNLVFVIYGLNVDIAHVEAAAEIADALITKFCQNSKK